MTKKKEKEREESKKFKKEEKKRKKEEEKKKGKGTGHWVFSPPQAKKLPILKSAFLAVFTHF